MAIKKAYENIVNFLNENQDKKVKSILPEVLEMCSAKGAGGSASTFVKDEQGNVVAIRCGYYNKWMPTSHVKFGKKAGSASGFNSMSAEGTNNYSRQQREFKQAKDALLEKVIAGELSSEEARAEVEKLEEARKQIIPRKDGIGFDTAEEAVNADPAELDRMVAAAEESEETEEAAE